MWAGLVCGRRLAVGWYWSGAKRRKARKLFTRNAVVKTRDDPVFKTIADVRPATSGNRRLHFLRALQESSAPQQEKTRPFDM